jgi:hypothetical protein
MKMRLRYIGHHKAPYQRRGATAMNAVHQTGNAEIKYLIKTIVTKAYLRISSIW